MRRSALFTPAGAVKAFSNRTIRGPWRRRVTEGGCPNEGPHRSASKAFRPDIEGLRAVAVIAVVLFHAGVPGVGGGFIGVDVFFVISGFLITGLLWREVSTTGTVGMRRFYGARARRLLPASAPTAAPSSSGTPWCTSTRVT